MEGWDSIRFALDLFWKRQGAGYLVMANQGFHVQQEGFFLGRDHRLIRVAADPDISLPEQKPLTTQGKVAIWVKNGCPSLTGQSISAWG